MKIVSVMQDLTDSFNFKLSIIRWKYEFDGLKQVSPLSKASFTDQLGQTLSKRKVNKFCPAELKHNFSLLVFLLVGLILVFVVVEN